MSKACTLIDKIAELDELIALISTKDPPRKVGKLTSIKIGGCFEKENKLVDILITDLDEYEEIKQLALELVTKLWAAKKRQLEKL